MSREDTTWPADLLPPIHYVTQIILSRVKLCLALNKSDCCPAERNGTVLIVFCCPAECNGTVHIVFCCPAECNGTALIVFCTH